MYRSRFEIERKLKQIEYIFRDLKKFENRIFVNNGLDNETGCYPLEIKLGTFLIYARSIFQYVYKEISGDSSKKKKYDKYINNDKIIKHFKELRDSEIHSYAVSYHTIANFYSKIKRSDDESGIAFDKLVSPLCGTIDDLYSNPEKVKEGKIEYHLVKRIEISSELLDRFKSEKKNDLIEAIENGIELFESIEIDGISDLFVLCEKYLNSIKSFIDYASREELVI